MKLSIAWLFDHIKGSWSDYDISDLVKKINATTAEVESVEHVTIAWHDFALARIITVGPDVITLECPEWKKKFTLPKRKHAQEGAHYLIKRTGKELAWATMADLHSGKDGLVAPLHAASHDDLMGAWRSRMDQEDYILEIGNVTITNRPDLWGHRGFAREVAAMLGLELVPEEQLVVDLPVKHFESKSSRGAPLGGDVSDGVSCAIDISQTAVCTRFAGIAVTDVVPTASLPWMVARLARVDGRAIDAVVDMTNYVLHDVGHPMHAFDATKITGNQLCARQARAGESLLLLDDQKIELSENDCVIADSERPLSLAGIMGGKESAVSLQTQQLFLEAAHFDPTAIRLSSTRHKIRTESSVRFEKNLDPNANTFALARYVRLLADSGIAHKAGNAIISVGPLAKEKTIEIAHAYISKILGVALKQDQVVTTLERLGFGVQSSTTSDAIIYKITVPTYRATKDIGIKEDIIEEVGRFFGYDSIRPQLPKRIMTSQDHTAVNARRRYKQHCAFALQMHEVVNYALYDENFLHKVGLNPADAPALKNPLSEHWRRLVTSLVPHLIKNIAHNCANEPKLSFFEWNRIWKRMSPSEIAEWVSSAGVFYERAGTVDFYACKTKLWSLFDMIDILVTWRKPDSKKIAERPWMDPYQQAELVVGDRVIGYAGMVNSEVLGKVAEGNAFAFELDMDAVAQAERIEHRYAESSKYQPVTLDVSMFVPLAVTVAELEGALVHADGRITDVYLVDRFTKDEWEDKCAVTIRYVVQDQDKTLTGDEIEAIQKAVHKAVQHHGVEVR